MRFRYLGSALLLALSLSMAAPAKADTAIGAGVFLPGDGSSSLGVLGSYNLFSVPAVPLKLQLSAGAPFGPGGRFAVTLETEYETSKFFLGGGAGGGKMKSQGGTPDAMYDLFAGVRLLPLISLQARYYGSGSSNTGNATYLGLSFGVK